MSVLLDAVGRAFFVARQCRSVFRTGSCCLLPALLCLLTASSPADAARFFHGGQRKVRACVLLLPSSTVDLTDPTRAVNSYYPEGENLNPFLFYVLDRRTDLRPDAWEFVDPIAPPTVTQAMSDRWSRIGGSGQ